jgi:hypothetical protein
VKSKDIRIESLQEQLSASSQEASRLIASLRAKLFELELTAESSSKPSSVMTHNAPFQPSSSYNHLVPFHSPNPFHYSNSSPNPSRRATPKGDNDNGSSDDLFADLAGNIFPQSHHSSSQRERSRGSQIDQSSPSSPSSGKPKQKNDSDASEPKNYISSAYRLNSKTGSPRPVSPSEASTHATDDPSPRVKKPSDSMRNLFNSKYNSPGVMTSEKEGFGNSLMGEGHNTSTSRGSLRPPLRGGSGASSQTLLSASSPVQFSPQVPMAPSPHGSHQASRPQSTRHSVPSSPLQHPSNQQLSSPSHDILQVLLAQSSSSPTAVGLPLKVSSSPSSREKDLGGRISAVNTSANLESNEDILDSLLKRRGISSAQRSSRSADSNRS